MDRLRRHGLRLVVHLGALLPLADMIWDGAHGNLSADPIREITLRTGRWALILLIITLACTPANSWLGFRQAIRHRRTPGLYAFLYASLHFLTFLVLDYGLNPALLKDALLEKRYALAGLASFLILAALAMTSTRGWMRRLGRRWKQIHRLVYAAAIIAIIHFLWLVKADLSRPLRYGAVVAVLLALRLPMLRRRSRWLPWRRYPLSRPQRAPEG